MKNTPRTKLERFHARHGLSQERFRLMLYLAFALLVVSPLKGDDKANQNAPALPIGLTPVCLATLTSVSSSADLTDGIEVHSGSAVIKILALRDDVLRVRIAASGQLPEDSSWAVLEGRREQHVNVTPVDSSESVGFYTKSLRVQINRATLRLSISDMEGHILQRDAAGWPVEFHSKSFRIYKEMAADEHYFGLGDKPGPLDRRGQSFTLWNTDSFAFQESTDPIYKSIPFFLTVRAGRSIGVLMDNTWRSSFDFGRINSDLYSFGADGGPIDYYVIYGPEPKGVLSTYAWLTGLPPLPPLWAFGYQQSRFSYETEARVRDIANRLRTDKIPADALYLDIDFQKNYRPFTVDTDRFPHFAQMLADLKDQNFHVVAITDLHIARLPNSGYSPYDSGTAGDAFVRNADGTVFSGNVWPGAAVFPEFTRQDIRSWWGTLYQPFVSQGVSGFWNDMNEPSIFNTPNKTMPDDVQHRIDEPGFRLRKASHLEIHNVYGMENSRATFEGLSKIFRSEQRPFVLTRATYAGGQRYAATWTGDNSSTWNHLRLSTPMLLNLGLSGFGISGADVGGFIGTPQAELLTRWTELATFQPIDRNHTNKGSGDKEPWVHGLEQEAIRRRYIEERYRLMPYLYTAAENLTRTGIPIMRPIFLEFPSATADGHPFDLDAGNEFLFGNDLLVAPSPYPEKPDPYRAFLPPGLWYNYWTGEAVAPASQKLIPEDGPIVQPQLDVLPVFVRAGAIIPMQPLVQSTVEIPDGPLTLRVYPGPDCRGSMYLDDGKTLAYKQGDYLRLSFSCTTAPNGSLILHLTAPEGSFQPWWTTVHVQVFGFNFACRVSISGHPEVLPSQFDPKNHTVTFDFRDSRQGLDISVAPSN